MPLDGPGQILAKHIQESLKDPPKKELLTGTWKQSSIKVVAELSKNKRVSRRPTLKTRDQAQAMPMASAPHRLKGWSSTTGVRKPNSQERSRNVNRTPSLAVSANNKTRGANNKTGSCAHTEAVISLHILYPLVGAPHHNYCGRCNPGLEIPDCQVFGIFC